MWPLGFYVVILLTICFMYLVFFKRRNSRGNNSKVVLPPGSKGFPIIGETLQFFIPSYSLDLPYFIRSRIQRYGPIFRTRFVGRDMVVSTDMEFNRYLVRQEGCLVELWYMDTYSKLFNLEGHERKTSVLGLAHKYVRNITGSHFGPESLREKLLPSLQDVVKQHLRRWSTHDSIDLRHATFMMMTEIGAKQLLGLDSDQMKKEKLADKLYKISEGLFSFPINIPGTSYHACLKKREEVMNVMRRVLKETMASPETGRVDFMDYAIKDLNTQSQKFLSEEFILYIMFTVFLVGDSGSILLPLIMKFLSENPNVLQQLEAEHERIVKSRESLDSPLTWNEIKSMRFTLNVVNESLRLGNLTLSLMRRALKDIQINGYTIPAGWTIMMVTSACHYDPDIYKDPFTFNPWRWEEMQPDVISKTFMPFGGGRRQCSGAEYTEIFMIIILHFLVTNYRWKKIKGGEIFRNPTMRMKNGFHIKLDQKDCS